MTMAWNNGYPATYGQIYPQGYPIAQQPAYGQQQMVGTQMSLPAQQPVSQTQMSETNQQPQMMTPPTIRAEIIQLADDTWENTVDRFPLGPGASQMFITKSEDKVIIKTMGQDGPLPLIIYDKRPPEPPAPKFDPDQFVRKDELEKLIKETLSANVPPRRAVKKEDE